MEYNLATTMDFMLMGDKVADHLEFANHDWNCTRCRRKVVHKLVLLPARVTIGVKIPEVDPIFKPLSAENKV